MRTKSIFTFLIVTALCFYGCTETEYVYVTSDDGTVTPGTDGSSGLEDVDDVCTKMTDENFKEYCYRYFDTNYDWKVSMAEAELVTEIDCSTAEDFTGIEYFTNLESFTSQSVKYIDLSRNILLSYICLSKHYISEGGADVIGVGAPIERLDLSHNVNMSEIAGYAFAGCGNLSYIKLPENIMAIGTMAFYGCESLSSIQLPDGLTSIGTNAFEYCTSLTTITFPESITEIWGVAFQGCTALTEITLPKNLTTLEIRVFQDCTNLKSVTLSENLTEIRRGAFLSCTSLASLTFPEGLTTIGNYAFEECRSLETITLPASLTTIGDDAFSGNNMSLYSVSVKATTPPSLGAYVFVYSSSYKASAKLYVPEESIEAYANSDWSYYFDIILAIDDDSLTKDGDGTRENPYTVSQALEMLNSGTYDPDKGYYVKGIVNPNWLAVSDNGAGWNISYLISDDGDYTQGNYLYVKHGFALGGEYFNSYDDLTAGDNVIVYGRLTNDDGVPEMINGKLYYWNGEFGELDDDEYFMERGDGSRGNPYSISQVFEITGNGTYDPNKEYYVKGIVSFRLETSTGNIGYYISEEGDFYPETNLFVLSFYSLDGGLLSSEDVLSPLDQVIVYGKLSMDSGQPTMYSGKLYYWNGETADVE